MEHHLYEFAHNLGVCRLDDTSPYRATPPVLKAGSIQFGGGAIDCTVRNVSETGAALDVVTPLFIPDRFTLAVQADQLSRPCRIVWRKERESA
jgi:hypothetical protein